MRPPCGTAGPAPHQRRVLVADPDDALGELYAGWIIDRSRVGSVYRFLPRRSRLGTIWLIRPISIPAEPGIAVQSCTGVEAPYKPTLESISGRSW
jgi:hypothetical protein